MAAPQNILLIRPSALGDVCRSVPVVASLRRAFPSARIDWLVQDSFVDAVWHHPGVTEAIPFARGSIGKGLKRGKAGGLWGLVKRLRGARYDLVLDCQGLARSGFLAWATGARVRAGYADAREMGWLGLNRRVEAPAGMHTVDRMLAVVKAVGVEPVADMRLYAGPVELAWAAKQERLKSGFAVVAPTSRWAAKRWPAERFAAVVERLLGEGVGAVAVVGGAGEREQCGPLLAMAERDSRVVDLVGGTSVGQLMALIRASRLVLANDSAALHMAVGFDRPSVGLFGPTRVELVGPYQKHSKKAESVVIQHLREGDAMDHKDDARVEMMERIGVDEVIGACVAQLGSQPREERS